MSEAPANEMRLCELDDLVVDTASLIEIEGLKLAVVRFADEVLIIGDTCSHADYSLSAGELDTSQKTLECEKHGAVFSLTSGEPESLPATKPVPTYEAVVREGTVYVSLQSNTDTAVKDQCHTEVSE